MAGDKRDDISAYALQIGERPVCHPTSVSSGLRWPQAGVRWCGVFQVVKTAQSRGRTGRTLLKALSQLLWPDKGREVWSRRAPRLAPRQAGACGGAGGTTKRPVASWISCSAALAKNNDVRLSSRNVACSSVVPTTSTGNPGSVCIHCETAYAVISALRGRPPRGARTLRTGVTRRFRFHIIVCYTQVIMPKSADAFPVVGGRCTGRARRCKAKQGRRARRR
jgi:hypothetical protein